MNITEDYFKNYEDEKKIDEKFINFHTNKKTFNIVLNTLHRNLTHETVSNFRVKFDANSGHSERIPVHLNSNANISGDNVNGFTFEGISYEPYNPNRHSGEIIGHFMKDYKNETGILVQKRFSDVKEIGKIRIEVPKTMLSVNPSFLYLHFDELSGFSNTYLPNGNAITFCAYSKEHTDHYIFETLHPLYFDSYNLQTLTFEISFPKATVLKDYATIFYAQINNSSNLELVTPNMPSMFAVGDELIFELGTKIVVNVDNIPHVVSVIDGYIDNSHVILRTFDGKLVNSSKTINGKTTIDFGTHDFLIATASGGIDTSIYEKFELKMKSLVFPYTMNDINITPITSVLTDYIIFKEREYVLTMKNVRNHIMNFETKFGLVDAFSDYIEENDIHMAYLSYQIVSTLKVINFLLEHMTRELVNPSKVSLMLSQSMIEDEEFLFTNSESIAVTILKVCEYYKVNMMKYSKSIDKAIVSLTNHNYIEEQLRSFDMFSKSALVLHKDLELNKYAGYNIFEKAFTQEELKERRSVIIPSNDNTKIRNRELGSMTKICYEGNNELLIQNIATTRKILRNVIFEFNVDKEQECLLPIEIKEYEDSLTTFGKLDTESRIIYLNKHFDMDFLEGSFKLNGNAVNAYTNFLICALKSILCSSEFTFKQNVVIDTLFVSELEEICLVNISSVFISEANSNSENIIIETNDNVIDFKESETITIHHLDCDVPKKDGMNKVSCNNVSLSLTEDNRLDCFLSFGKSVTTGILTVSSKLFLDDIEVEMVDNIIKVGKRVMDKSFKFETPLTKNMSHIRVETSYFFSSFKEKKATVSTNYNAKNTVNFANLPKLHEEKTNIIENVSIMDETNSFVGDRVFINPLSSSPPLDSSGNIDYTTLDLTMQDTYTITSIGSDSSGNSLIEVDQTVLSAFNNTDLLVTNKGRDHYIKIFNPKAQIDLSIEIVV